MKILGIETSCDETAAAVIEYKRGRFNVLSNSIASQIKLHRKTGGIVPEVAAREHLKNIIPIINSSLWDAQVDYKDLDRIGVVTGPGLITSLLVGSETAKNLAYLWQKKIYSINHLEAHIGANFLKNKTIKYPALCLIVSGGHTEIVLVKKYGQYKLIGATRDDAAGECFDKCAKILGLPYPGGPEISKRAAKGRANIDFPSPMIYSKNFEFSFSGLKTSVLYYTKKHKNININNACASIEKAIVNVLIYKLKKAQEKFKAKTIMLAGGVSANLKLREEIKNNFKNISIPDLAYCTDNAVMVAVACAFQKKAADPLKIKVNPNWEIA